MATSECTLSDAHRLWTLSSGESVAPLEAVKRPCELHNCTVQKKKSVLKDGCPLRSNTFVLAVVCTTTCLEAQATRNCKLGRQDQQDEIAHSSQVRSELVRTSSTLLSVFQIVLHANGSRLVKAKTKRIIKYGKKK